MVRFSIVAVKCLNLYIHVSIDDTALHGGPLVELTYSILVAPFPSQNGMSTGSGATLVYQE
jgi:hypothetical protein